MNKSIILYKAHDSRFAEHENSLYEGIESLIRTHVTGHPEFDVCFVKCNPDLEANVYDEKNMTFWVAEEENYSTALRNKVAFALHYFFVQNDFGYQSVFITNLSTIVNVKRLSKLLEKNAECQSVLGYYSWPPSRLPPINYYFPSGAGCLLKKNTVSKYIDFLRGRNLNLYPKFDDTILGYALHHLNIPVTPIPRKDLLTVEDCTNLIIDEDLLEESHIRIKTSPRDKQVELQIHVDIYNAIYETKPRSDQ